jgi:hypothetical protein
MRKDSKGLHPDVLRQIEQGNRDRPLTLNWRLLDPDVVGDLDLPDILPRNATEAQAQMIAEALAAGYAFISYSRRFEFYAKRRRPFHKQRYYPPTYTFRAIVPAVDQLAQAGLFEHDKAAPGDHGYQSRFRASPELTDAFQHVPVVYEPLELIVLRDDHGNPVDYRDTRNTRAMRRRLEGFNESLLDQQIGLGDQVIREGDPLPKFKAKNGKLAGGGRAQIQMHQVFGRGSWNVNGRFVGSFWQNIPDRSKITINGKPAVEVDYNALHIRLLYQERGQPMPPGDAYEIDGWPREHVKLAMLIVINARTHLSAVRALADALRKYRIVNVYRTAEKLIDGVKRKHRAIAHAFNTDAGARLMRQDSELAANVMGHMMKAVGIVPLCVHDSFLVPVGLEGQLMAVMDEAIGIPGSCRIKRSTPA